MVKKIMMVVVIAGFLSFIGLNVVNAADPGDAERHAEAN